ncbi:MAG: hypothetical protein GF329_04490 [Candidatus Lokiarchaeota archaeon]|nr:hypothetical protein [Candidatus Lokiarchaeota archaeon]
MDIETVKTILLNPDFWETVVKDTQECKKISVIKKDESNVLHQEMILKIEIDSFGLIKRDIETIQDIHFDFEESYENEEGINIQKISVHVENSNQLRKFNGIIKIEEKPGKARITFTLEEIGITDVLVELLGIQLTNRRLKRGLRKVMQKVFDYSESGKLDQFTK